MLDYTQGGELKLYERPREFRFRVSMAFFLFQEVTMKGARFLRVLSTALLAPLLLLSTVSSQTERAKIQAGSQVSIQYTLLDEKGKKIESNKGGDPFKYTHGKGDIIPGLENGLEGMKVGEEKSIEVKPEDAYGKIQPEAFQEVPRKNIPPELLKVGTTLAAKNHLGRSLPVRVHEIKDETVVLNLNHPLAGITLTFEVKIIAVQPAQ